VPRRSPTVLIRAAENIIPEARGIVLLSIVASTESTAMLAAGAACSAGSPIVIGRTAEQTQMRSTANVEASLVVVSVMATRSNLRELDRVSKMPLTSAPSETGPAHGQRQARSPAKSSPDYDGSRSRI
jgi:hypothetical protein